MNSSTISQARLKVTEGFCVMVMTPDWKSVGCEFTIVLLSDYN